MALDALIETADDNKDNPSSPFYRFKLGARYISIDSPASPDSAFESEAVNIQRNQTDTATDAECSACANLQSFASGTIPSKFYIA